MRSRTQSHHGGRPRSRVCADPGGRLIPRGRFPAGGRPPPVSDLLLSIIRSPDTRIPAPNIEGPSMPHLSVVIPVYGCADCLTALHGRLTASLEKIGPDWEIVYVDDRSPDGCWQQLTEFAGADSRVRAYRLSRNFGQHAAITAGLARQPRRLDGGHGLRPPGSARGDSPPLRTTANEGHDIVLTRRDQRTQERSRDWLAHVLQGPQPLFQDRHGDRVLDPQHPLPQGGRRLPLGAATATASTC